MTLVNRAEPITDYSEQPSEETAPALQAPPARLQRALIVTALVLILALGAFLRFYELGTTSIGNTYYAATVQSMLTSWHNFFFASFEPGGSVTVDKPPLGFWIQAVSAYFLGVNGFSLALPQALAGVLSVLVLYFLVRQAFGAGAGLLAALALAVTPVAVSTERNNTIDGLLVLALLLAAWAFLRSVQSGRVRYLMLGAFLVGLGFNIKMLQAFMPLPAFYLVYLLGAPHRWWQRLLHLGGATLLLLVVSLSWAVIVDLTPVENRPYIGSSKDNSVLELIAGHNGLSRLVALGRPRGDAPGIVQRPGVQVPPMDNPGGSLPQPPGGLNPQNPVLPGGQQPQPRQLPAPPNPGDNPANPLPGQPMPGAPGQDNPGAPQPNGRNQEIGEAGWLRLFSEPLVTESGWLLPLGLLAVPLALAVLGWRWPLSSQHLAVALWAGWLLPAAIYFTFTTGLFHAYYLIMLGPPLAALVGVGVWSLWQVFQRRRWLGWALTALLAGAALAVQIITLQNYPRYSLAIAAIALVAWFVGMGLLAWPGKAWLQKTALALVCLSLVVAPLAWSGLTAFNQNTNFMLPRAGPADNPRSGLPAAGDQNSSFAVRQLSIPEQRILDYVLSHAGSTKYLLATRNANQAAPYILATLRPVLAYGGFSGGDNVIDVDRLAAMVASGELRFVLSEPGLQGQKPEIAAWLTRSCTPVTIPGAAGPVQGQPGVNRPGVEPVILYDCGLLPRN